jgi:hypothetical protein
MSQSQEESNTLQERNPRPAPIASLIQYAGVSLTGKLKHEQALVRLGVVALIQLVGVSLTFWLIEGFPRSFGLTNQMAWQNDCLIIACVLAAVTLVLLVTFVLSSIFEWPPGVPEVSILLTFIVNIVSFSLAMERTGGPSNSFFAQLIPMQLSGILILEQQRAMMTSRRLSPRWRALVYAGFTILVWVFVVRFPEQVQRLCRWQQRTIVEQYETWIPTRREAYERWTATILFILGIVVTAFAYWVTPRLVGWLRRRNKAKQSA